MGVMAQGGDPSGRTDIQMQRFMPSRIGGGKVSKLLAFDATSSWKAPVADLDLFRVFKTSIQRQLCPLEAR